MNFFQSRSNQQKNKKKIIRKQSIFVRIKNYPFDLYLQLNEKLSLIDLEYYVDNYLKSVCIFLNTLFFFCRIYQIYNSNDGQQLSGNLSSNNYQYSDLFSKNSKHLDDFNDLSLLNINTFFQSYNDNYPLLHKLNKYFLWLSNLIITLIILISISNTYFLFNQSNKLYTLLTRNPSSKPSNINTPSLQFNSLTNNWQLKIWNPLKYQLILFSLFSPINCFYLLNLSSISWSVLLKAILQLSLIDYLLYYLIFNKFLILILDKQFLFSEILKEYDIKFVHPNLNKFKREVSIDATNGPNSKDDIKISASRYNNIINTNSNFNI
ncbi:Nur1/Mug154 family protein ASCRUDRAFT_14632 [Ascoidea rubescens DSM 1968]|uniref:Nuclear rim protein 1 n=1 Tax=Ascoidea rubescens DSM 1968 TaxID=1344418 RepID=A0A1D2VDB4_9ASCO|nr:hypothetical protein ASCRUDRAFT_14632 [Ascoidea rubescens DSM 1968]ODV59589.1 hypothetical protein ASCRUDRAFT_14632 [Ascoidea rubescens DSM 1968]